jgi:hypothetical protein
MSSSVPTLDDVNLAIRNLIRFALELPDGTVMKADDDVPAGAQTTRIATVRIMGSDDAGWAQSKTEPVPGDPTALIEAIMVPTVFTASVNFYRGAGKTAAGVPISSMDPVSRASGLGRALQHSRALEAMQRMGLGIVRYSQARNLTGLVAGVREPRGQVDVLFQVISRDAFQVAVIASAQLTMHAQQGSSLTTQTIEVSQ